MQLTRPRTGASALCRRCFLARRVGSVHPSSGSMFASAVPAHRIRSQMRFDDERLDLATPRLLDSVQTLNSIDDRVAGAPSGRWASEFGVRAKPKAVSWNSHRFLRKQHDVRTNSYSGETGVVASRFPMGRVETRQAPDNEQSIRMGASHSMRDVRTPHTNDGTIGKDTRMGVQLPFPGSYQRGNSRSGLPIYPRAESPSDRGPHNWGRAYIGQNVPDPYDTKPVENDWMRPSSSAGGWSKMGGRPAGDPALERRTLRSAPIFTPWNKLESWQVEHLPRTPLVPLARIP